MKNCSGGIRTFGTIILACCLLAGALMVMAGCSQMDSLYSRDSGIGLLTLGISTFMGGGVVYSLFNGFAQLLDDVRAIRDRYAGGSSQN